MPEAWFLLALAAAVLWGITSTSEKYLLARLVGEPCLLAMMLNLSNVLVSPLIFALADVGAPDFYSLAAYFRGMVIFTALSLYFMALKRADASRVIPLYNSQPLFVLLLATLLFGEAFEPVRYLGIFVLVVGAVLVSWKGFDVHGLGLIIGATVFTGLGNMVSKWLVGFISPWTIIFYSIFGYFTLSMVFYRKHWPGLQKWMGGYLVVSWLGMGGFALSLYAMALGPVSLVVALLATQSLWVLIFASLLSWRGHLNEHVHWKVVGPKLIAIALIILGVYLIS